MIPMNERPFKTIRSWRFVAVAVAILLIALLFVSRQPPKPALLVTLVPAEVTSQEKGSVPTGTTIARQVIGSSRRGLRVLAEGFAEVGVPRVSYDGRRALFSGRRRGEDSTGIWEASTEGSFLRSIVRPNGSRDPCYLPDGRIVYARPVDRERTGGQLALYTALRDGSQEHRITFGAGEDRSPRVLPDGRIVFRRRSLVGSNPGRLFVVATDGTGVGLFCAPDKGASIDAGPWQIGDRLIFVEASIDDRERDGQPMPYARRLVSVSARQPLGRREILSAEREWPANRKDPWVSSVCRLPEGAWVACGFHRSEGWRPYQLRAGASVFNESVLSTLLSPPMKAAFRPVGLVVRAPRERPLRLTSIVNEEKSSGTLLCLDVYSSRLAAVAAAERGSVRSVRVLSSAGAALAEAAVETDGSFFVEVPADQPLNLELLGPAGVVAEDKSGFWVRPNENRGCIGCHQDPESAPENRVPLALTLKTVPLAASELPTLESSTAGGGL